VVAKPADELGPILSRVMDILSKHDLQLDDKEFDVVIAVGGDGTLLRAVGLGKPVIGVRAGKRGLLMDVPPDKFEEVVVRLKRGEFRREEYGTLWFNYMGLRYAAFNDVALLADGAGTATFRVQCSTQFSFDGDGLVIATPQGSTGWSLSASGPYVDRKVNATVVTLINPVLTPLRSLVVSTEKVKVRVVASGEEPNVNLLADGNRIGRLKDEVEVHTNGPKVTIYRFFDFDPVERILRKDP